MAVGTRTQYLSRTSTVLVRGVLLLLCASGAVDGRARKVDGLPKRNRGRQRDATWAGWAPEPRPVVTVAPSCADRPPTAAHAPGGDYAQVETEVDRFYRAVTSHTAVEVAVEVAWLLADVELGCTPELNHGGEVFEKINAFAWQVLHNAEATRRGAAAQLRVWEHFALPAADLAMLRERVRLLDRFAALEGETAGCAPGGGAGCGQPSGSDGGGSGGGGSGGWRPQQPFAEARWGGAGRCEVRTLTAAEWAAASPCCLRSLFEQPFVVRGGNRALVAPVLNASNFDRGALVAAAGGSAVRVSTVGDLSRHGVATERKGDATLADHLAAMLGLGRIVALYYYSSTLSHIF
jgi:hypothetical protein